MEGSLTAGSIDFITGGLDAGYKGGSIAVAGAAAGIIGGIAGAIGLGLVIDGMLNPR
ncbi:hypothetical protein [Tomitella biformata]|uniref:hypothetical protein n=1 Tax=Tomitella biformata TaxID=630403 RepID=UPI0004B99B3D|nr:hypothetical protein [Tomitella biformata]